MRLIDPLILVHLAAAFIIVSAIATQAETAAPKRWSATAPNVTLIDVARSAAPFIDIRREA